jgi:hypothetical protein
VEILVDAINILLLLLLVSSPIIIVRFLNKSTIKFKFISYFTIGLFVTAIIILFFAWWSATSKIILLKHYDAYFFNPDSNSYQVSYEKVSAENSERVKSLETGIMGIGWPLKAIFMFVCFLPILVIVYSFNNLIVKIKKDKNIIIANSKVKK